MCITKMRSQWLAAVNMTPVSARSASRLDNDGGGSTGLVAGYLGLAVIVAGIFFFFRKGKK